MHRAGEKVTFTAQYPIRVFGRRYTEGDQMTVTLRRDWEETEGMGEGGPWGYGGYPTRLLAELGWSPREGHAHTCIDCGQEIEFGEFDCEADTDHDFRLCDECAEQA